jgi:hypothetical protein
MKKELQRSSSIKVLTAILSGIAGLAIIIMAGKSSFSIIGIAPIFAAAIFWYWGLGQYCLSKGYSGAMAAIGVLGLPGLIILLVLPDRYKVEAPPVVQHTNYPRSAIGSVTTIV